MKIAIHVDGRIIRGNEEQVLRIADGLHRRGHTVVVSCRAGGPVEAAFQSLGIRTTGIRPRGDVDLWSALRFARWLARERVDAVLLTSWLRAFIAGWAASRARVSRVVFRIGGMQPIHDRRRGMLERFALRHWYDAIVANSHVVADSITGALPDIADRVRIVLNGIRATPELAETGSTDAESVRSAIGLPHGAVAVIAVGGLEPRKGYDLLIDAIALTGMNDLHAVLVGGGTAERRTELDARAQAAGLEDRVHFLGRRADVPALLDACDVFVLSSLGEGLSVACLEAMRAGLPVISSAVGGAQEMLAERDDRRPAGWIVPREDVAALAAALREVVTGMRALDADVSARQGEAEWRVANWFTLERMVDGYEAALTGTAIGHLVE